MIFFFFLMIRRPPRSTLDRSSAASDVYKRQILESINFLRFSGCIDNAMISLFEFYAGSDPFGK